MTGLTPRRAAGIALDYLDRRADNHTCAAWALLIRRAGFLAEQRTDAEPLLSWMQKRDGAPVDTLQIRVDPEQEIVRDAWSPGPRRAETSHRKGQVRFTDLESPADADGPEGSWREYRGLTKLASSENIWVGYDSSMHALIVYVDRSTRTVHGSRYLYAGAHRGALIYLHADPTRALVTGAANGTSAAAIYESWDRAHRVRSTFGGMHTAGTFELTLDIREG